MARTGPTTRTPGDIALGLAQVRMSASLAHIAVTVPVLTAEHSIGSLASTKFIGEVEYFRHESGFPAMEDLVIPMREKARIEAAFEEISIKNLAIAKGLDPSTFLASDGDIALGVMKTPASVRVEVVYTFPDGSTALTIIFPRAQVSSSMELDFQKETNASVAITIESKIADSGTEGGDAAWDDMPLGIMIRGTTAPVPTPPVPRP